MMTKSRGLIAVVLVLMLGAAACAGGGAPVAVSGLHARLLSESEVAASTAPEDPRPLQLAPIEAPRRVDLAYRDIVNPERRISGSLSEGTASAGRLSGSVRLPLDTDTFYVLRSNRPREAYYATEELADLVSQIAADVAEAHSGSRVALGDASARRGGDIPHHASHNSGRDIDFPFLIERLDGTPDETDSFLIFDEEGLASRRRFDVERNWCLVRSIIERSEGTVQWIFVARTLRRLLLDYAREAGEPDEIIARASDLLWQPSMAGAHDDHFHVRIYCSPQDRIEGCIDTPPYWSWVELHHEVLDARVDELLSALSDEDLLVRVQAVEFLVHLDARQSAARLADALSVQPAEVQLAVLDALASFRQPGLGHQVVALVTEQPDPAVRRAALRTAARVPMPEAADQLVALLLDDSLPPVSGGVPVSRGAARALLEFQDPDLVGHLIDGLLSEDDETRVLVARALSRTTGFTVRVDWERASRERRARAVERWRSWYAENRHQPRDLWVREAFERVGIRLPEAGVSRGVLSQLIDEVDSPEPIGYLAQQRLVEATGRRAPPTRYSPRRKKGYWRRIVERLPE